MASPVTPAEVKDKIKDKIPPGGLTVQELLEHMKEKGPHGLKKEFDTLATFDRASTYDIFKYGNIVLRLLLLYVLLFLYVLFD